MTNIFLGLTTPVQPVTTIYNGDLGFYLLLAVTIATFVNYILMGVFLGNIFAKFGVSRGKAFVPFYRSWIFFNIGGLNSPLALLAFAWIIPFIGWFATAGYFVFRTMAAYGIAKEMGKQHAGAWTALFFFFPWVWAAILGLNGDTVASVTVGNENGENVSNVTSDGTRVPTFEDLNPVDEDETRITASPAPSYEYANAGYVPNDDDYPGDQYYPPAE